MSAIAPRAAEPPLVLALDVGTSSARALLYDAAGRALANTEAQAAYALDTTPDGGVQVDADVLVAHTLAQIDAVARAAPTAFGAVRAVAAATFWHSVVGVDRRGRAITPLLLWADARGHQQATALRAVLDERAVHARTGCLLHWSYLPAKLRWLADTRPAVVQRVQRWLSFGEYLYLRLFGTARCSVSMASASGLFDQHTQAWDPEVLGAVPVEPARLSPVDDAPLRGLPRPYAARWPALRAVPWYPAYGDGACSNVGAGCVTRARWALMIGTSGALRVAWRTPDTAIPWGVWGYRIDAARVVLGGALNDGGSLYAWLTDTLRLAGDPAAWEAAVAAMPPDGHGLTVLPFLGGERSPGWAALARGAILGLTLDTAPLDVLRAGLEAVALRFALLARLLEAVDPAPEQVVATGGALRASPAWTQIVADALGRPVVLSAEPEASSRGAALLALEALGVLRSVETAPAALGSTYLPNPTHHAIYQAALARQEHYYTRVIGDAPRDAS